jgi:hypothetical protein
MARQGRRTRASEATLSPAVPLEDALAATHEQSVPVLPANALPVSTLSSERISGNTSPTRSYARASLAPQPRPAREASGAVSSPRRRTAGPAGPAAVTAQTAIVPRVTGSHSAVGEPPPRHVARAGALEPGRPSLALPALTDANLPVVAQVEDRQLALGTGDEPAPVLIRGANRLPRTFAPVVPKRRGPPSFAAQFIITMFTVMTLFTVAVLGSPLAHTAGFTSTFQAYASAMPWVPTPTPTPRPTPTPIARPPSGAYNPGQQAIINEIIAVFGSYSQGALNVAHCESGYDPNAYNPYPVAGSHAEGVFQILYPSTWDGTSYASSSPYNATANIHAAYQIFARDGYSWREWQCQP